MAKNAASSGSLAQLAAASIATLAFFALTGDLMAHAVGAGDRGYIMCGSGVRILPFIYLGAKHMVTGYDHLLFLCGVIFFLYRGRDLATYVTLFALGHSVTLLLGVLMKVTANAHLIDAIIGLSVAYKALDNIGLLKQWFGFQPNAKAATMIFGLFHGLGLATKMLDFELARDGLIENLVAFNVGVEIGQLLALGAILIAMSYWRRTPSFTRNAFAANVVLTAAGVILIVYQLLGYMTNAA